MHAALNQAPLSALPDYPVTADFDMLFNAADAALYDAKRQDRNRVNWRTGDENSTGFIG